MKRTLVGGPAAAAAAFAAASILVVGASPAYAATTFYVNAATGTDSSTCGASTSPCKTIGQAVDKATDGDTIVVAAGMYESVSIFKSLTLEGAQAGNAGSATRAAEDPATESVVTGASLAIAAPGVTVDGFSFGYAGNQVQISSPNATIENNVFSGYQPNGYFDSAVSGTSAPGAEVTRNYFTSPTAELSGYGGAVVQWSSPADCSGVDVSDNTFEAASSDALSDIYFFCEGWSGQGTVTVSGNHDTENTSSFAIFQEMGGAVSVTNNTVSMVTANSGTGMIIDDDPHIGAVDIRGNTLTGSPFRAVKIIPGSNCCGGAGPIPSPVTITGNDFSGNGVGVYVGSGSFTPSGSLTVHGNNLSNESGDGDPAAGLYNAPGSGVHVDAIDNWWGCNTGPNTAGCSTVTGDVAFDPWLLLGISANPSSVTTGDSSTITADVTHDSAGNDASASGTIPDGTTIAFATDFGILSANTAGTNAGKASVGLGSPAPGTANVSATLDNQTVSTTVTFTSPPVPTSADQCKKGGWQSYGMFKNQGDCVSFVATHGKNPGRG